MTTGPEHGENPDFLVPLWRAIAVFRTAALVYAGITVSTDFPHYRHQSAGWIVFAVMTVWTAVAVVRFPPEPRLRKPLLVADLAITAACVLATPLLETQADLIKGESPIAVMWMGGPVLAWATSYGRRAGSFAGGVIALCDFGIHIPITAFSLSQLTFAPGLLVLCGAAVGHLARLAVQAQAAIERGARLEAAARERERLARGIHDSVLQVLARVARQGLAAGGEAAELGRLAGEQEVALRALIGTAGEPLDALPDGTTDLRTLIAPLGGTGLSVAAPASAVHLPSRAAQELSLAVRAALDNVRQHGGADAKAWILIEDEPAAVTVTIRDDGPGFAPDRLENAAAEGRLGVAQSILGRVRDLGGDGDVRSWPGEGTEVELRLPRPR